jgi:hypothetical protein
MVSAAEIAICAARPYTHAELLAPGFAPAPAVLFLLVLLGIFSRVRSVVLPRAVL